MARTILRIFFFCSLAVVLTVTAALSWLRLDAGRSLDHWFEYRHGTLSDVEVLESMIVADQVSELLRITSTSGLEVTVRSIRKVHANASLAALIVLGGHRTGSDAAILFGDIGERAVIALDYPYGGPEKVTGIIQAANALPLARQAFRDTPSAVSLVTDWLLMQSWLDKDRLMIAGASLGVPFATLAAARDTRIRGAILVHGAADNQAWLETQVARRIDSQILHRPLANIIHWLAYGPTFATGRNIGGISPRPVLIIGARNDERTPTGQTEQLYAAAREPKWLRWTEGAHVQPGRSQIVADLLMIADEMLPLLHSENK